jgi:hypothetical protein
LEITHSFIKAINYHNAKLFYTHNFSAIFHIYAMQLAIRLFPENKNLRNHLDELFVELRQQYDESFDDCALRMASVVLMVGELNEIVSVYRNYVTMLELNGYKSVFSQEYGTSVELVNGLKPF